MSNLDSISSISPISFTDIDNQSVRMSDTYKDYMQDAYKLNKKNLATKSSNDFGIMSVKGGVPQHLETSATSSAFMTEIMNQNRKSAIPQLSATSNNFMTEIMKQAGGTDGVANEYSATSSAFMTDIMRQAGGNNIVEQTLANNYSATSDAFMTEIQARLQGGAAAKKAGKSVAKSVAKPVTRRVAVRRNAGADDSSTEDSSTEDSSEDSEDSKNSKVSESDSSTQVTNSDTSVSESSTGGGKFTSGTRYLFSETERENNFKTNNKSFFNSESMSSTLATEDLTLLR
jgi:hypothetical protein